LLGLALSDIALLAVLANETQPDEPIAQPASAFSTGGSYARLVYARTATILETLARVYGDAAVSAALGLYARRNRFEHPGPSELVETFEHVMGAQVARTLRAALFEKGWVDYAVESVSPVEVSSFEPAIGTSGERAQVASASHRRWHTSVLVRRRGTLSFPVDVEFVMSDGATQREHWDGNGDWKRFHVSGSAEVRAAIVDPDDRILLDADPSNNRASAPGAAGGAPRTFEWATYLMELLLQTALP
jgi:hypothetical protein